MRDKVHNKAFDAINFEYGYDTSKHDEWNTYANEELDDENRIGFSNWNEREKDLEDDME
jgi:hypothetical protein